MREAICGERRTVQRSSSVISKLKLSSGDEVGLRLNTPFLKVGTFNKVGFS
jgi:hypothetical protein